MEALWSQFENVMAKNPEDGSGEQEKRNGEGSGEQEGEQGRQQVSR